VSDDAVFRRLESLAGAAEVDELAVNTEASRIGSDLEGLSLLVNRYAQSNNRILVRAVTFPLARAAWEIQDRSMELCDVVFTFVRGAGTSDDAGTLTGCATALQGLNATQRLVIKSDQERDALSMFLSRCVDHADLSVRGVCLHLLGHLYADRVLEHVLDAEMVAALRVRLRRLERESGSEFRAELAALDGFLNADVI
jgi:hypothetical protein